MHFAIYSNRHTALQLCHIEEYDRQHVYPKSETEEMYVTF